MNKLRAALIVMIILVALASWYKNQKREEAGAAANGATPTPAATPIEIDSMPAASPTPQGTPASGAHYITPENLPVVRECLAKAPTLARVNISDRTTLEDILRDLAPKTNSSKINLHVRRADGHEERLLVTPAEGANKHAFKIADNDLRVFGVDSEGLPIAREFPRELKRDSLTHAVNAFIGSDAVTFRERRAQYAFEGGVATSVETNGSLTELQLNYGRTTLGCAWQNNSLNCACL